MEKYTAAELQVIAFDTEDVIRTSPESNIPQVDGPDDILSD